MDGYEIERRFLVRVDQALWATLGPGNLLQQGYLHDGAPSVRIRLGETRGPVLTVKRGSGVKRREMETIVPADLAEGLMEAAGKRVIEKVRFRLGPWEIDRFRGGLDGLTLLEVEFDDPGDPVPEPPKGVEVLREVTDDKRLTSGHLARLTKKEQKKLVRKVYEE